MKAKILSLAIAMVVPQFASAVLLNESDAKVYNCLERITKIGYNGVPYAMSEFNENVQVIDYGGSFMAVSTQASAMAFSGILQPDIVSGYKTGQPVKGVTMGKGFGEEAGTYIYIGEHTLISWNCRK